MLPPLSVPIGVSGDGVRMSNSAMSSPRGGVDGGAVDGAPAPERRLADALEHQVEAHRLAGDDALAEPVVGDIAEAQALACGDRRWPVMAVRRRARMLAARRRAVDRRSTSASARWPLPSMPAMPRTSPRRRSASVRDAVLAVRSRRPTRRSAPAAARRTVRAALLRATAGSPQLRDVCDLGDRASPNMMRHDPLLELLRAATPRSSSGSSWPDHATRLEHGDPVADRDRLVELVGDEDDGEARGLEAQQHLLQLRDALRA